MLRSILEKDNDRIKAEIQDAEEEVVFELGHSSGGMEVTRYVTRDGKICFRTSGGGMTLDENDDEKWVSWEDEPVLTFEGALAELRTGINFLCLRPISLHHDYRDAVRQHIEALLAQVTADDRKRMGTFLVKSADQWFSRLRNRER